MSGSLNVTRRQRFEEDALKLIKGFFKLCAEQGEGERRFGLGFPGSRARDKGLSVGDTLKVTSRSRLEGRGHEAGVRGSRSPFQDALERWPWSGQMAMVSSPAGLEIEASS